MARKRYSCDFETTTDPNDCRVWVWGACELYDEESMLYDNSIESFIDWCRITNGIGYFHNLRFDGEFIVNWLLHNGYTYSDSGEDKTFTSVISAMGQWYKLDICFGYVGKVKQHMELYDSLKKLPFPVKTIATGFGLEMEKGEIDYHEYRPVGHKLTVKELKYLRNDIKIVGSALETQLDQGLKKMTNGSDALADFKDTISKTAFENYFPILSLKLDKELRKAYRGGFTWLAPRYIGLTVHRLIVYDVNSLYPSQMKNRMLPVGFPIQFEGKYREDKRYPLYIQEIRFMFEIKEGFMPTIQIKNNSRYFKENEYLESSDGMMIEMSVTNIDLDMIFKHYDVYEIEYIKGWKFQQRKGIFDNYIDKWTLVKTDPNSSPAVRLLAKLMLNSLYGKFATNPKVTGKFPFLKEDGSTGFRLSNGVWETQSDGKKKWILKEELEEYRDPVYTPMGIFITSWARHTTITSAQKNYPERLIYVDTDSQHLEGWEEPDNLSEEIHPSKLGFWKLEGKFDRGKFLRQKTYVEELNGKLDVKCAGMPDRVKANVTFDNFKVGFTSSGKLMPKHVNGGVVLVDGDFTIK